MNDKTKNHLLIVSKVNPMDYYNNFVVPLNSKFRPMSDTQNTGLCPFHKDTDPSLRVWEKKKIFHCFGCGFGGDIVYTHSRLRRQYYGEKPEIKKIIADLAQYYNIELYPEEEDQVLSVFERAKAVLTDKDIYIIPQGVMTLTEFRQLNNKVKRSSVPQRVKVSNFEHLDLVASVTLSNHTD